MSTATATSSINPIHEKSARATGMEDLSRLRRLLPDAEIVYMPADLTTVMQVARANIYERPWRELARLNLLTALADHTAIDYIGQKLMGSGATIGASDILSSWLPVVTFHYPDVAAPHTEPSETINEIHELLKLPPGWTGYDVAAPRFSAIEAAVSWIKELYVDVQAMGAEWHAPHVAANADGDVLFEWWNDDTEKGLAVYVSENGANFILDWGTDLETEMEDGDATTPESRRKLWSELMR
jgi:hypothetical protein